MAQHAKQEAKTSHEKSKGRPVKRAASVAEKSAKARTGKKNEEADEVESAEELDDEELEATGEDAGEEGAQSPFPDDPVVDRKIIEGMLHDRKALMTEMAERGWTQASVLRRAADLGLSEALIRQVRGVANELAGDRPGRSNPVDRLGPRLCLQCDRVFLSTGPQNRLCMRCRGGDAGLAWV